ncbi:MAG: acetyl-CoA carboxylase biotin carboxyl carrier protein subunit [Deltaproteobacteria bacterium]|nr:acetyl-CoA carboxylase biotin carboxyl carrier protein subunit [Deltaproteobacteria bacterium]
MAAQVVAPMPGKIIEVNVKVGDQVKEDDPVVIMEAMKIEMPIVAVQGGKVAEVRCEPGQSVESDAVLVIIE